LIYYNIVVNNAGLSILRRQLEPYGIDALLVTRFFDILYLTGFKTLAPQEREAYVLVTKDNVYVFSDGRYAAQSRDFKFRLLSHEKGLIAHLSELGKEGRFKRIGFQKEDLKWHEYDVLSKLLQPTPVPVEHAVLGIRGRKSPEEARFVRRASEEGDRCLEELMQIIRPGVTEKEIAWHIEKRLREKGLDIAFEPIVAVDANAAVPHYDTKEGSGVVGPDSVVLIDFGVSYKGYNSDITRMFFTGNPGAQIRNAYETLLDAQNEAVRFSRKGVRCADADRLCRERLAESGFPGYPHSTGHGIGLEVHEYPKISSVSPEVIEAGNIFTIEPGIYMPGKWGMRIEDTVYVGRDGSPETLTGFTKEFMKV